MTFAITANLHAGASPLPVNDNKKSKKGTASSDVNQKAQRVYKKRFNKVSKGNISKEDKIKWSSKKLEIYEKNSKSKKVRRLFEERLVDKKAKEVCMASLRAKQKMRDIERSRCRDDKALMCHPFIYDQAIVSEYDLEGYNVKGFDCDGYNRDGYSKSGYDRDGYDSCGYDMKGYDYDGYDYYGYDCNGVDSDGYDMRGYDSYGYDRDGLDRNGKPVRFSPLGSLKPSKLVSKEKVDVDYVGLGKQFWY